MSTRRTKRPGLIEPPRDVISTKRERVFIECTVDNVVHKKVMIISTYETINTITIYVGNRDIYCMDVQLLKDDETQTAESGYLTKVRWDSVCSIGEPFGKGIDTIIMVKLLVLYIHSTYPNVKQLLFNDMSTRTCDDGGSVSLAAMKLLTDGETWYEAHFDITTDKFNRDMYNMIKTNITNRKKELTFDKFSIYSNINTLDIPSEELRYIYDNSNNWQEFFSEIKHKIGISKLCIWLSRHNWFDVFTHTILKINISSIQFTLNIKPYAEIRYTIVNNNGGRRNRR